MKGLKIPHLCPSWLIHLITDTLPLFRFWYVTSYAAKITYESSWAHKIVSLVFCWFISRYGMTSCRRQSDKWSRDIFSRKYKRRHLWGYKKWKNPCFGKAQIKRKGTSSCGLHSVSVQGRSDRRRLFTLGYRHVSSYVCTGCMCKHRRIFCDLFTCNIRLHLATLKHEGFLWCLPLKWSCVCYVSFQRCLTLLKSAFCVLSLHGFKFKTFNARIKELQEAIFQQPKQNVQLMPQWWKFKGEKLINSEI